MIERASRAVQFARLRRTAVFALVLFLASAGGLLTATTIVRALPGDLDAIVKASDLDHDPQDFQAVADVCTKCHAASQFLTTERSDGRWEQVFELGQASRPAPRPLLESHLQRLWNAIFSKT